MSVFGSAVAAEWTKLWTTRTVWWALTGSVLLMAAAAGQYAVYVDNGDLAPGAPVVAHAVDITQFALIGFAMVVMTGEYSAGTIRATLAWVPSRGRLLLAKSAVVAGVTFVVGTALGVVGALMVRLVLGDRTDTGAATVTGDAVAIAGYLALIAVFATGLGAALRGPVATMIAIFLLMLVVPPLLLLPDTTVLNRLVDGLPGPAGANFLRDTGPYPPAVGLLIVAGWACAAVVAGWYALRRRDA